MISGQNCTWVWKWNLKFKSWKSLLDKYYYFRTFDDEFLRPQQFDKTFHFHWEIFVAILENMNFIEFFFIFQWFRWRIWWRYRRWRAYESFRRKRWNCQKSRGMPCATYRKNQIQAYRERCVFHNFMVSFGVFWSQDPYNGKVGDFNQSVKICYICLIWVLKCIR